MTRLIDPSIARQFDRLPPHSVEAEGCALSALMLCGDDRGTFDLIRAQLRTESFYQADHGIIFDVVCEMADRGKAIDAVLVSQELKRRQLLEDIGGVEYLAHLLRAIPSAAHGPHYAGVVREMAILRGIITASNDALRRCYAPMHGDSAAGIAAAFADELVSLARTGAAAKFCTLGEALMEVLDAKTSHKSDRIRTGLADVDDMIGGIPLGEFTLIGGRPSMGKSQIAKQVVLNAAAKGDGPCAVVTIEETRHKVAENALSNLSGVENNRIAYGTLGPQDWHEISQAEPKLRKLPVFIDDVPLRLDEVTEAVTVAVLKHKCRLVVVDYLQLIDPGSEETENREITKISRALKGLAKRLNVALIAVCQLNRGNESSGVRRPTLRDLRGSGSLEQDGDLIILLHREDYYRYTEPGYLPNHRLEAIVAKNKKGCVGTVPLHFSGKTQRVTDWRPI
jgi:replicative DNA helicase